MAMGLLVKAIVLIHLVARYGVAQPLTLAERLADADTRKAAIVEIESSDAAVREQLLRWAVNPPPGVDRRGLKIGLADAFGAVRLPASIPFLIANIGLKRWTDMNTWLKNEAVIEERMPCVRALIQMGPESATALAKAWPELEDEERTAALFVMSRVRNPQTRDFLAGVVAQLRAELRWAEDALRAIPSN